MSDIVRTLEFGDLQVEIDEWGGVHYHHYDDPPLSLDPQVVDEIEQARQEAR